MPHIAAQGGREAFLEGLWLGCAAKTVQDPYLKVCKGKCLFYICPIVLYSIHTSILLMVVVYIMHSRVVSGFL